MEVIYSKNTNLIGVKGKIIDETKNMIILENNKMIQKNVAMVNVDGIQLDGKLLVGRSEDRLKKVEI